MMARVIAAADRGVKVRILLDDLSTILHDMTHIELRDAAWTRINRHPNIEIRVFNAWRERSLLGRAAESLWDFDRLNRRMHNKQMVVDNRLAILGGRNLGDEYFGLNPEFNFHDLDVLGIGPVARQASAVFDRYWNSEWVRRVAASGTLHVPMTPSQTDEDTLNRLEVDSKNYPRIARERSWTEKLSTLAPSLHPGRSQVHADSPSRATGARNHTPDAFRALLRSARQEVLIVNAYVIPDAAFVEDLHALVTRGVAVRILTNSLASHDVAAVNSHYESWRVPLLRAGVQLYELRADAALRMDLVETPPVRGRFVGLHTKAMVVDRQRSFIGSMNLDPRSEFINAEMGLLIESASLAEALAREMERGLGGDNAWRLELDAQERLRWVSNAETVDRQPARNAWQRLENLFFKLFPPYLY